MRRQSGALCVVAISIMCAARGGSWDVCEHVASTTGGPEWLNVIMAGALGNFEAIQDAQRDFEAPQSLSAQCLRQPLLFIILSVVGRRPDERGHELALRLIATARRLALQLPRRDKAQALSLVGGRLLLPDVCLPRGACPHLHFAVKILRQATSVDAAYLPAREFIRSIQKRLPKDLREGLPIPRQTREKHTLDDLYERRLQEATDIDEHLPILRDYASRVGTVAEMGVRSIISTYAFLKGLKESNATEKKLWCVDLQHIDMSPEKAMASAIGVQLEFMRGDSARIKFPGPVGLLFIDTFHVYAHLKRELEWHHINVGQYIIMHDTTSDEWDGEVVRMGELYDSVRHLNYPQEELMKGLWPAIEEFLAEHSEWEIEERRTNNNGLTILARVAAGQTKTQQDLHWKRALSPDLVLRYEPPFMPSLITAFGETYQSIISKTVHMELHDDSEGAGQMYRRLLTIVLSSETADNFEFSFLVMGLIRSSIRMGDWNMVHRAFALVRRFPPSSSRYGTNGEMMRSLLMLVNRMHAHELAMEQKAAEFRASENREWNGPEVPSTSCTLQHPIAPFPSCTLPIHDSIEMAEVIVDHDAGIRTCSAHNCSGMHCELWDVCLTSAKTVSYFTCDGSPPPTDLQGSMQLFTHSIIFESTSAQPSGALRLQGTTMLASAHSTLGHFVEFASKWPGLLAAFNGTVNRVMLLLYYRRRGYAEALDPMCELLRLAFFSAKVDLPRVYSHKALETLSGKTVCFERMIVNNVKSAQHIEHFESREAATNYRDNAWRMCGLDPQARRQNHQEVVRAAFLQRQQPSKETHERKFLNLEEVCRFAGWAYGIHGKAVQSDSWSFCDRVRLAYESDIIVGLHSSHMLVEILFARPGSVIIDISTFNFRRPGFKSLGYQCGVRYLEFLTLDKDLTFLSNRTNYSQEHVGDFENATWWSCSYTLSECQEYYKTRSVVVPVAHINAYLAEALEMLDQDRPSPRSSSHRGGFELDACQQPDARFQREGLPPGWNWRVCEPTLGRCFRSASCSMAYLPGGILDVVNRSELEDPSSMVARARDRMFFSTRRRTT